MPIIHPSDESYLDRLFYGNSGKKTKFCTGCNSEQTFYTVKGRKCYQCRSGHQISPLTGTIMQGTRIPLWKWFRAIELFSICKNGVSAKELERHLDIAYRHAWKMGHTIRSAMSSGTGIAKLTGVIEVDESYIGGKKRKGTEGSAWDNKATVFGILQRKGEVRTFVVKNRNKKTLIPLIKSNVETGSTIYSDEHGVYQSLQNEGYKHGFIRHNSYKWKDGEICTNSIEGYWSKIKRSIRGTHIHVSKKWLQNYLDEFDFRHSHKDMRNQVRKDLLEIIFNSSITRQSE